MVSCETPTTATLGSESDLRDARVSSILELDAREEFITTCVAEVELPAEERKSKADMAGGGGASCCVDGGGRASAGELVTGGAGDMMPRPSKMLDEGADEVASGQELLSSRAGVTRAAIHISASTSESARREKCSSPAKSSMRVGSGSVPRSENGIA